MFIVKKKNFIVLIPFPLLWYNTDQNQPGEGRFCLYDWLHQEELRQELTAGNWGENPGNKIFDCLTFCFSSANFLTELKTPAQRWRCQQWTGTLSWYAIKRMPHRSAHRSIWWEQLKFSLPKYAKLTTKMTTLTMLQISVIGSVHSSTGLLILRTEKSLWTLSPLL